MGKEVTVSQQGPPVFQGTSINVPGKTISMRVVPALPLTMQIGYSKTRG